MHCFAVQRCRYAKPWDIHGFFFLDPTNVQATMQYQLISQQAELDQYLASLADVPLAIDTEFVRTRTYYPQLGLFQIYDGKQLALLDPLTLDLPVCGSASVGPDRLPSCTPPVRIWNSSSIRRVTCPTRCTIPSWRQPSWAMACRWGLAPWSTNSSGSSLRRIRPVPTGWRAPTPRQLEYAAADVFYLMPSTRR